MTASNIGSDSATNAASNPDFQGIETLILDLLDGVQELADGSRGEGGLSSGFPGIDRLTGGFQLGDLIVLAGAPSMGKTALANNMAAHVVLEQDLPVAVFSMELSAL